MTDAVRALADSFSHLCGLLMMFWALRALTCDVRRIADELEYMNAEEGNEGETED